MTEEKKTISFTKSIMFIKGSVDAREIKRIPISVLEFLSCFIILTFNIRARARNNKLTGEISNPNVKLKLFVMILINVIDIVPSLSDSVLLLPTNNSESPKHEK